MAFDDIQAELSLLINRLENQPEDRHEIYLMIHEKLNELRAMGLPVPDDLAALEKALGDEFTIEAQNQSL